MKFGRGEMTRLDVWLVEKGYFVSRQTAKRAIKSGSIRVAGKLCKPSMQVQGTESIEILDGLADNPKGFQKLRTIDQLLDHSLVKEDCLALDIGSSAGGFLSYLAHKGAQVIGVEVSPRFLRELETLVERNDNISVIVGDAFNLDLSILSGKKELDLLLIDVTTDVDGTLHLVRRFSPLMKPQGRLLAAFKSPYSKDKLKQVTDEINDLGYTSIQEIVLDENRSEFHITARRM